MLNTATMTDPCTQKWYVASYSIMFVAIFFNSVYSRWQIGGAG